MANTIFIAPAGKKIDVTELPAADTILPGTVGVLNNGNVALAGASAAGIKYIVGENVLGEIDQPYSAGETVQCHRPQSGEYYMVRLAASQTIARNAPLATAANGLVTAAGSNPVVAFADEAVTTGAGQTALIRVYIK
ncbi:MAG: hypothetical protein EOM69_12715 [Clostridia bacterium]|nr:hypothetical protein [Clostridia bacterium]